MRTVKTWLATIAVLLCSITANAVTYSDWTSTNHGQPNSTSSNTYTITASAGDVLTFDWVVSSELLLSAKNRKVRNNVSAVPINRYCGFIFQKVSPLFSQRVSVLVVMSPILPVFSTSPSRDIQRKYKD